MLSLQEYFIEARRETSTWKSVHINIFVPRSFLFWDMSALSQWSYVSSVFINSFIIKNISLRILEKMVHDYVFISHTKHNWKPQFWVTKPIFFLQLKTLRLHCWVGFNCSWSAELKQLNGDCNCPPQWSSPSGISSPQKRRNFFLSTWSTPNL